ncbi:MAG: hypothetical protein FWG25_06215 [Promicromonosporaceae bacterium]|nr:hypothetical protein [Promicromonosporaceae bacterium]
MTTVVSLAMEELYGLLPADGSHETISKLKTSFRGSGFTAAVEGLKTTGLASAIAGNQGGS